MDKAKIYRDKINELDVKYALLQSDIIQNRQERDLWQESLDNIDKSSDGFPKKGGRDVQIIYILENVFQRAVTMNDLETKHTELNGEYKKLSNVTRRLKDEGKLCSVRYNKQNTMTFWGLTKWIVNGDYKDEFKPLKKELPFKTMQIEKL